MCALDAKILRDAVLVCLENIRFEAYVHVNALLWKVAFAELLALTNRNNAVSESGLGLNLMELNALYEYLWNVGVLLQSDGCLDILNPAYRTWPKVHEGDMVSTNVYRRLKKNKIEEMEELNSFTTRADVVRYTEVFKKQLGLFGLDILTSLERTMGNYLKVRPFPTTTIIIRSPYLNRLSLFVGYK